MRRTCVSRSASARAEGRGSPRRLESHVRLARPAVGFATLDDAATMAEATVARDRPTLDEAMQAGGCPALRDDARRGDACDGDAICILDIGRTGCRWFTPDVLVPAGEL